MDKDIRGYSVDNKRLVHDRAFLELDVPGLAEKRPSVLKGDSVLVHHPGQPAGEIVKYKGYVHDVMRDKVKLKFDPGFHRSYVNGQLVNVEFTYNRMTLRICHQSVDTLTPQLTAHILPSAASPDYPLALNPVTIYPVNRALNEQQMLAVKRIVQKSNINRNCPYIIYGPPGTGKTSTIVEAIKQVGKMHPTEKVLICAPSNTAADLLLRRLADTLPAAELFRFNSYQRDRSTVDAVTFTRSLYDDAVRAFIMPPLERFLQYKYVVCTCTMAGKLVNYGIPRGHFSTVFVDEAGHGWEPEVIAGFSAMLNPTGQLILAGDPQQLGPIVRSDAVDDAHGALSLSLLHRLIETHPAYVRDLGLHPDTAGFDSHVLTKLIQCYRCHPDILRLPNELFYDAELLPAADRLTSHNMCTWAGLPKRDFPLIFHGIEGENIREASSPSWYNIAEIEQVFAYVRDLVDTARVPASDIAVIAPYHKQVTKIAQLLRNQQAYGQRYADIMVGTCEKMQGQERRVIIISTVRSSPDFLDEDKYFSLGFVANPKRFNVAVTRAKALLIVVGNPHVLQRDPCWGALLRFCVERGGYTGCDPPNAGGPGGGPGPAGAAGGGGAGGYNGGGADDSDSSDEDDDGEGGGGARNDGGYHGFAMAPPAPGGVDDLQGLVVDVARMGFLQGQRAAAAVAAVAAAVQEEEGDGLDDWERVERADEADWARVEH